MVELQVKNVYKLLSMALPPMIGRRSGNIVIVSSIWGQIGASCEVLYSMVKGTKFICESFSERSFFKWITCECSSTRSN